MAEKKKVPAKKTKKPDNRLKKAAARAKEKAKEIKVPESLKTPAQSATTTKKRYESFKLQKRIKYKFDKPLPYTASLLAETWRVILNNKKTFFSISLFYGLLYIVMVQSVFSFDITATRDAFTNALLESESRGEGMFVAFTLVGTLFGVGVGASDELTGAYATMLAVLTSLAYIWALRQIWAHKKFRIRDAWYKGMYPLIPVILIMFVMVLQAFPLGAAVVLMTQMQLNGLIATGAESFAVYSLLFFMAIATGYYLVSTLMAYYVVTIPDVTPVQALDTARNLVEHRRWAIFQRLLWFLIVNMIALLLLLLLLVWLIPKYAFTVLIVIAILALQYVHTYFYVIYRKLL